MKKIVLLITFLLFITGCDDTQNITCKMTDQNQESKVSSQHVIIYRGDRVVTLRSTEIIETNNMDLSTLQKHLNSYYQKFNNLEYYTNINMIENNKLISKTMINYDKIDIDQLQKLDSSIKILLDHHHQLSKKKLVQKYLDQGAICKH